MMPRTTINLSENLLRQIRARAARENRSMGEIVEELLRRGIQHDVEGDYNPVLKGWSGTPAPGIDLCDRDKLFDVMEDR